MVALKLGTGVVTARLLGPAGRGLYFTSVQVPRLTIEVGTLSVEEGLIYRIASGDIAPRQVLGTILFMTLVFSVFLAAALAIVLTFILRPLIADFPMDIAPLLFLILPAATFESLSHAALKGLKRFGAANRMVVIAQANLLALLAVALLFWSADFRTGLAAYALARLVNALLYAVVMISIDRRRPRVAWTQLGQVVRFGSAAHIGTILTNMEYRLDAFLLLYFLNAAAVGIYSLGAALAQVVWYVSNSINNVLFPHLVETTEADRNQFTAKVLKYTFFANLLTVLGLAVAGYPLVELLYGTPFIEAYFVFLVLAPGLLLDSVGRVLAVWLKGSGRPLTLSWISGISLVVNIASNIVLIPIFGLYGAALASVISYTLRTMILCRLFVGESGVRLIELFRFSSAELVHAAAILRTMIPLSKST